MATNPNGADYFQPGGEPFPGLAGSTLGLDYFQPGGEPFPAIVEVAAGGTSATCLLRRRRGDRSMIVPPGATSISVDIQWLDDTGAAVTGKVAADFPACKWSGGSNTADTTITLSDLAAITTAHPNDNTAGGVKEREGGWYRLDLPNNMLTSAGRKTLTFVETTNKRIIAPFIDCQYTQADVRQLLGTAWLTPAVAGTPDVNAKQIGGQAAALNANNFLKVSLNDILATTLTETSGQLAGGFKKFFNVSSPASTMELLTAVTTVTTLTNLPAITAGWLTATGIAADAITAAKIADGAIDAATFAAGAINAAAIAADAITDAKVASDVTIASVTGAVGSVIGAVGSVTGNVGGNVTGSVGSIATGGIAAASFAAGAIDAAAIAANAIGASELATDAVSEIAAGVWDLATSGHTTSGSFGEAMNAAGSAGDPWTTSLPGSYTAGQAGYILGTNLDAVASSIKAKTDNLPSDPADASDIAASFTTVNSKLATITSVLVSSADGSVNDLAPSTTSFKTTLAKADNFYNDALLVFTSGALSGQARPIADYAGPPDGVITVDEAFTTAPTNGDTFLVQVAHIHPVSQIQSGLATQASVDDLPTNTELATALAGADDAVLAAIGALNDIAAADVWTSGTRTLTAIDEDSTTLDLDATIAAAVPTAVQNADALLGRNIAGGSSTGRTVKQALYVLRNKVDHVLGKVYETDDTTVAFSFTVTTDGAAEPITIYDPS